MKATLFFIFYFLTAAFLAALLIYPLYELVNTDAFRFERWVTRAGLIFLVLGIFPVMKYYQLSYNEIGHKEPLKQYIRILIRSFIIGLPILGIVMLVLFALKALKIDPSAHYPLYFLTKSLLGCLLAALIEETLFRGVFFTLAKKWHGTIAAVLISSFFYATFHFVKPIVHIDEHSLSWLSGFEVMFNAFHALLFADISDYLALFSVGIFLALVRYRTNSLAFTIGLHASWIFLLKMVKEFTSSQPSSEWGFLTGQHDGIIGLLSASWLILLSVIYIFYIIKKPIPAQA